MRTVTLRASGYALGWLRDCAAECAQQAAEIATLPGHFVEAACLRLIHDGTSHSGRVTLPADADVLDACGKALSGRANVEDEDAELWARLPKCEPELARMARAAREGLSGLSSQCWREAARLRAEEGR